MTDSAPSLAEVLKLQTADPRYERYRVTGKLGEGGMGQVLLGVDTQLDREVAIKIVIDATNADSAERFHREAQALARINHTGILRVFDYSGLDAEKLFLVTERLHGQTLADHTRLGPLTEVMACVIGAELAGGLAAAHAAGLIHRDVKPNNIVLEPSGRVVLIDFGVAKGFAGGLGSERRLTGGALVGTPRFASPEQCNAEPELTPASDLFSLGAVLYYCVTQQPPFTATSLFVLLDAVANKPHVPLLGRAAVSPEFSAIIDRLLAKKPQDRLASAEALGRELTGLAARERVFSSSQTIRDYLVRTPPAPFEETLTSGLGASGSRNVAEVSLPAATPRPRRVSSSLVAAVGLLVAALLVATVLFAMQKRKPPQVAPVEAAAPAATVTPVPSLPKPAPPPAPAKIQVRLFVKPWAKVMVDGEEVGITPTLRVLDLTPGPHQVVFTHPTFGLVTRNLDLTTGHEAPGDLTIDMHAGHR